jgi:GAF domain-containing protein
MATFHLLAVIRPEAVATYADYFNKRELFTTTVVKGIDDALDLLSALDNPVDIIVIDNGLSGVFKLVGELRQTYPRLLIVLVDEDADFSTPGRADDVSTEPFVDDDLFRRIQRLVQERQTETLRADTLPPVRTIAKKLRQASGAIGKTEAAVSAISEMGYDFVVFYRLEAENSPLIRGATAGSPAITSVAPDEQKSATIVDWVARHRQSRIIGPDDEPNYSLIKRGRLGAGVCIPVGSTNRFGVILAGREQPDTITQENVLLLELICTQLAAALAKEVRM